jgi:hypothetical protein
MSYSSKPRNHNSKRRSYPPPEEQDDHDGEHFVDDMAIAASYAMATAPTVAPVRQEDDNAIDIDIDGENDNESNTQADAAADVKKKMASFALDSSLIDYDSDSSSSSSSSSDSEKKEDLTDIVQALEEEDEELEDELHSKHPPKTLHEVDPIPIQQLTLKEQQALQTSIGTIASSPSSLQQQSLRLAGTVQEYIVSDRMLVVQSQAGTILESGTLLILLLEDKNNNKNNNNHQMIPCGKILDIFGPVRQPLYSVPVLERDILLESNSKDKSNGKSSGNLQQARSVSNKPIISSADATDATATMEPVTPAPTDSKAETDQTVTVNPPSPTTHSTLPPSDPWAASGAYTHYVQQHRPNVYYLVDVAQTLDTSRISHSKGCDASNAHDEEVTNPEEMDYSDDEQERSMKRRGRGGQQRDSNNGFGGEGDGLSSRRMPFAPSTVPQGFHSWQPTAPLQGQLQETAAADNNTNDNGALASESDTIYYD